MTDINKNCFADIRHIDKQFKIDNNIKAERVYQCPVCKKLYYNLKDAKRCATMCTYQDLCIHEDKKYYISIIHNLVEKCARCGKVLRSIDLGDIDEQKYQKIIKIAISVTKQGKED